MACIKIRVEEEEEEEDDKRVDTETSLWDLLWSFPESSSLSSAAARLWVKPKVEKPTNDFQVYLSQFLF